MQIDLPTAERTREHYRLTGTPIAGSDGASFPRVAYAAAHVVADPLRMADPWSTPVVDWDRTMAFRHHLWRLGFSVAEAMDTSQRGMGFDWNSAKELIRRSVAESKTVKGAGLASVPARTNWPPPRLELSTMSSRPTKSNLRLSRVKAVRRS